jgi:hypothetical protein
MTITAQEFAEKNLGRTCFTPLKRRVFVIGYAESGDILVECPDFGEYDVGRRKEHDRYGYTLLRMPKSHVIGFNRAFLTFETEITKLIGMVREMTTIAISNYYGDYGRVFCIPELYVRKVYAALLDGIKLNYNIAQVSSHMTKAAITAFTGHEGNLEQQNRAIVATRKVFVENIKKQNANVVI